MGLIREFRNYFFGKDIKEDFRDRENFWVGMQHNDFNAKQTKIRLKVEDFIFRGLGNYFPTAISLYGAVTAIKSGELSSMLFVSVGEGFRAVSRMLYDSNKIKDEYARANALHSEGGVEGVLLRDFDEADSVERAIVIAHREELEFRESENWKERAE